MPGTYPWRELFDELAALKFCVYELSARVHGTAKRPELWYSRLREAQVIAAAWEIPADAPGADELTRDEEAFIRDTHPLLQDDPDFRQQEPPAIYADHGAWYRDTRRRIANMSVLRFCLKTIEARELERPKLKWLSRIKKKVAAFAIQSECLGHEDFFAARARPLTLEDEVAILENHPLLAREKERDRSVAHAAHADWYQEMRRRVESYMTGRYGEGAGRSHAFLLRRVPFPSA